MFCRHPVQRSLHFPSIGRIATLRRGVVGRANLGNLARSVLHDARASDEIGPAQADFPSRRETEELGRRIFSEVIALDVNLPAEWNFALPRRGVLRIVHRIELLALPLRIVLDDNL